MQTPLPPAFPQLLHLFHLSKPDELYDLHLKLILLHTALGKYENRAFALAAPDVV